MTEYDLQSINERKKATLNEMNGIIDKLATLDIPASIGLTLINTVRAMYEPTIRDLDTQERVAQYWAAKET